MDPFLQALIPLAAEDDALAELSDRIRRLTTRRSKLDAAVSAAEGAVAALQARTKALSDEEKGHQREIARLEGLVRSAEEALAHGHGDPAMAERQIATAGGLLDTHETAVLEGMEARDALNAELAQATEALAAARAERERLAPQLDAELDAATTQQRTHQRDRVAKVEALPREVRGLYEQKHRVRGSALAAMAGDTCAACQNVVPFSHRGDLKAGRLVTCDGCGRWLYLPTLTPA